MANSYPEFEAFVSPFKNFKDANSNLYCNRGKNLVISSDENEDNNIVFGKKSIKLVCEFGVQNIRGDLLKIVYKDKKIKSLLKKYVATGNQKSLLDVFYRVTTYARYQALFNNIIKDGREENASEVEIEDFIHNKMLEKYLHKDMRKLQEFYNQELNDLNNKRPTLANEIDDGLKR